MVCDEIPHLWHPIKGADQSHEKPSGTWHLMRQSKPDAVGSATHLVALKGASILRGIIWVRCYRARPDSPCVWMSAWLSCVTTRKVGGRRECVEQIALPAGSSGARNRLSHWSDMVFVGCRCDEWQTRQRTSLLDHADDFHFVRSDMCGCWPLRDLPAQGCTKNLADVLVTLAFALLGKLAFAPATSPGIPYCADAVHELQPISGVGKW